MDAIKKCEFCGTEFTPNSGKQVCCTERCNVKKWRKYNPQKAKAQELRANKKRKGIYRYNSQNRKEWYKKKKKDPLWKEKINKQANQRSKRLKAFIRKYKLSKGCKDCGYNNHHAALEFDHIYGEKKLNISFSKSIAQAKNEIKKCEVVCANCHSIRTFNRLQT